MIYPKERIIYTPDRVFFPGFIQGTNDLSILDGIFSWLHPKERMILLPQYTLDQKLYNLTYASNFFWVIAFFSLQFRTSILNCFGHSRIHVLSYWFPDLLFPTSRTQAMCTVWVVFEFSCRKPGWRVQGTLQNFGAKGKFCQLFLPCK